MRRSLGLAALAVSMSVAAACSSSPDGPSVTGTTAAATNANANSNTGASTSAADTGDTADSSATTSAPLTSLPADPAAAIKAFYASAGGTLSDAEATCIVQSTGPTIVDDLNTALKAGTLDTGTGKALLKAFATCEPSSYVQQTTASLMQQSGATQDQAACVLKAVDKLFSSDDAVLTQAAQNGTTSEWPAVEHQRFTDAVKTCVPDDLAAKIVDA